MKPARKKDVAITFIIHAFNSIVIVYQTLGIYFPFSDFLKYLFFYNWLNHLAHLPNTDDL